MRVRLSRWIALGFGAGLSPVSPGTIGTLLAWASWWLGASWLSPVTRIAVITGAAFLGIWACARTAEDLGVHDHRAIVWDEIVAFWLVLALVPGGYASQFAAFVAFRFFDIVKPPPIRQIDRGVHGGLGIMLDDLAAAAATVLVMLAWPS